MTFTITSATQLSTHFKSLRKAKGWSQADLGLKLGIGQARVAQIESDPGSISVDKLLQILHLLDAKLVIDAIAERKLHPGSSRPKKPLAQSALQGNDASDPQNKTQSEPDLLQPDLGRKGVLPALKNSNRSPKAIARKKW